MDISELLTFGVEQGASDLHLSAGVEPIIRVDGDMRRINLPVMDEKQVHTMIYDIRILSKRTKLTFPSRFLIWHVFV